jgi:hypothetical protein
MLRARMALARFLREDINPSLIGWLEILHSGSDPGWSLLKYHDTVCGFLPKLRPSMTGNNAFSIGSGLEGPPGLAAGNDDPRYFRTEEYS